MRYLGLIVICCWLMISVSGCTHALEVKNIETYQNVRFDNLEKPLKLGIVADPSTWEHKQMMGNVTDMLLEHSVQTVMQQSVTPQIQVDAIARIDVKSAHDGSGTNFWIEWPGFLIFTPCWNGYIYEVKYDFKVQLLNSTTQKVMDEFNVPVTLDIRHADIGRTWTEISWLEVSLIAFVSGFVFMNYDAGVTPQLLQKYGRDVGRYVAKQIIDRLKAKGELKSQENIENVSLAMFDYRLNLLDGYIVIER